MTTTHQREPEPLGQTVVVIGGSAGIGLETARRARAEGADVILAARSPERLQQAATEVGARSTAAFDVTDLHAFDQFFAGLPETIDHVMLTGPGPYYAPLTDLDRELAHRDFDAHLWLAIAIAQRAVGRVRPGGTLVFMGGTGGRNRGPGLSLITAGTAAQPALIANLAVEVAPIRVNLIAAGFVDTPLSAQLLGEDLEARRAQLRATLPIRRVVGPADIAALAVHLMINTAITGPPNSTSGPAECPSRPCGITSTPTSCPRWSGPTASSAAPPATAGPRWSRRTTSPTPSSRYFVIRARTRAASTS